MTSSWMRRCRGDMSGEIQRGCFDRLLHRGCRCQGQPIYLSRRKGCCRRMQSRQRKARSEAAARSPLRHSSRCEVGVPLKFSGCAPYPGGPGHGLKTLILHTFARQAAELPVLHCAKGGPSCTVQKHGSAFRHADGSKDPPELTLKASGSTGFDANRYPGQAGRWWLSRMRWPGAHRQQRPGRQEIRSALAAITDMMALSP